MYPLHLYAHRQTSDELEAQSENTTLHSGCICMPHSRSELQVTLKQYLIINANQAILQRRHIQKHTSVTVQGLLKLCNNKEITYDRQQCIRQCVCRAFTDRKPQTRNYFIVLFLALQTRADAIKVKSHDSDSQMSCASRHLEIVSQQNFYIRKIMGLSTAIAITLE